jgi:hypothetical protein
VADKEDSTEQCTRLEEQAKSVPDEECQEILRLLDESGKLRNVGR